MSSPSSSAAQERPTTPSLVPLTPRFNRDEHGIYVSALEAAVPAERPPTRNIALTGGYGSGKSSILDEFTRLHGKRIISVSLSTLGTSGRPAPEDGSSSVSGATNRIQKEIVKQLLHSRDPIKTPGSRYRRTTRFRLWRELMMAVFIAAPLTLVAMLAGWSAEVWIVLSGGAPGGRWVHLVALTALTLFVLGVRRVLHNRYQIDQITAGATTITLSNGSGTYFDEYLDEIVYLFEVTKRDIVVFEDIDRFDEAEIFETLRALNTLLNGAQQLRGRTVRFVYAIKDSIFDELARTTHKPEQGSMGILAGSGEAPRRVTSGDAARAELARANRTKFFDLIIPVVPFLTHRSARDLVSTTMDDVEHDISAELIDVAARHVADMRLIKDIRNEFTIFRQRVMTTGQLELNDNALFAMILYKTTHLSDFEAIRLGQSNLDELYRASRNLAAAELSTLGDRLRALRRELARATLTETRGRRLGRALTEHLDRFSAVLGMSEQSRTFAGHVLDAARAETPAFWLELAQGETPITMQYLVASYNVPHTITMDRDHLSRELDVPINAAIWEGERRADLREQIERVMTDREFLAHADMGDLLGRPQYMLKHPDGAQTLRQVAEALLGSELAMDLLAGGYIDRNFTLYTATFHVRRVSARAMNYIIKNVDPGIIDMHYVLEPGDVQALVRERPRLLEEPSAYNIHFLDGLLAAESDFLDVLVRRLAHYGSAERALLLAYMESGEHQAALIARLTPHWAEVFEFVLAEAVVEDDLQLRLIDAGLSAVVPSVEYEADGALAQVLEEHGANLPSLTSRAASTEWGECVARVALQSGAAMPDLGRLAPATALAIATVGAFEVTRANLEVAVGADASLALDDLAQAHRSAYERCLIDLDGYLSVLGGSEVSVTSSEAFPGVIEDVLIAAPELLDAVVASAATECLVENLTEVPTAAWPVLAAQDRIRPTPPILVRYLEVVGLDEHLGQLLLRRGIELADGDDEDLKRIVAVQVLSGAAVLPSPEVRADLAASLCLEQPLVPSDILQKDGELLANLISRHLVEDGPGIFAILLPEDFPGRDAAISASPGFAGFATQEELPLDYIEHFLVSDVVPAATKDIVVERFAELTEGASPHVFTAVASHALRQSLTLSLADIQRLARGEVPAGLVVSSLQPHLQASEVPEVSEVLTVLQILGGAYAELTERNGKHPHLPLTAHDRTLLGWLKEQGLVSSYREVKGALRAYMRRELD